VIRPIFHKSRSEYRRKY